MSSEYSCLEDVAEIIDSLHKTPSYSTHGFPMVRVTDVKYGNLALAGCHRVDEATYLEFSRRFKPRVGDIVMTRVGTYGVSAIVRETNFCLGQNTAAIVPNGIHPRYLYAALNSAFVREQIEAGVVGSTQKTLSLKNIKALKVPRHGEDSENAIAELIATLDDRIALLRETNATLEAIAQALFKSWFVDFDPVRAKAEGRQPEGMDAATAALFPDSFEESKLGWVPKGWSGGTLADLAHLNPESWSARTRPESVAYVDLANAKENVIAEITDYRFDDAPSRARRVLRDGDTIVGTVRPGNRSFAFIANAAENLTGSTGFAVLRPKNIESTEFVYLAATLDANIDYLTHVADGGAYPAVRPEVVVGLATVIPPAQILQAFHEIAKSVFAYLAENHVQAQTLTQLRDTLLPRLISGQLRLPEAESRAQEAFS